jgi:carbonic anhydrase/acetyltransferase-like protein (isoleucine patch superfamily)
MPLMNHHGVVPKVHPTSFVAEGAWIIGDVEVGEQGSIWFNAVLRGDINHIRVGARSNVQDGCVVHVTQQLPALIGDDVTVGHMAMLHGCHVGDACLIGMNAVILDNARVGPRAIVAAGSVVKENFVVPEGTLVAGVPARVVRDLTEEERSFLFRSALNYVEYARSFMV